MLNDAEMELYASVSALKVVLMSVLAAQAVQISGNNANEMRKYLDEKRDVTLKAQTSSFIADDLPNEQLANEIGKRMQTHVRAMFDNIST